MSLRTTIWSSIVHLLEAHIILALRKASSSPATRDMLAALPPTLKRLMFGCDLKIPQELLKHLPPHIYELEMDDSLTSTAYFETIAPNLLVGKESIHAMFRELNSGLLDKCKCKKVSV